MVNPKTVLVVVATVIVLLLAYRFVFNPQVLLGSSGLESTCPSRWEYSDGLCKPRYETNCMPFDPQTITSKVQGCNIARSCGTDWPGKCA